MLDTALDYEIAEKDFWEMTLAELERAIQSKIRRKRIETQEKASCDYILANLIVKGVSITLGAKDSFPAITEVYPNLFEELVASQEEDRQQKKMQLSALRFKQFAQSYNSNYKNKEVLK